MVRGLGGIGGSLFFWRNLFSASFSVSSSTLFLSRVWSGSSVLKPGRMAKKRQVRTASA